MKRSVLKGIFFGVVLFVALLVFEILMNHGNTDMTAEMPPATFPLVYMNLSGERVNCLHGYGADMDEAYMRDTITPIDGTRKLGIEIEKMEADIARISYEIRNGDGSRLIENTELTDYAETKEKIAAYFTVKDLIKEGMEYNLCVQLELMHGQKLNYYTRIIRMDDCHVSEKIAFVKYFNESTFDKQGAAEKIAMYLEPDATGDNSTFQKVNIHSSLNQITWGNLPVQKETSPVVDIKEMMEQTASFHLSYLASIMENREKNYYLVDEYYRIRYTPDRTYLLEYDRDMEEIFNETKEVYGEEVISLGIQNVDEIQLMECDGGEIFAVVIGNRLFSYNATDGELALLFSFYENQNYDARTLYNQHRIKILNVDETGNVQFVVYGYMNRGRHEGDTGVQINRFNSSQNVIEEIVFVPYRKSPDLLIHEVDKLAFSGNNNRFYMMIDNTAYEMDLNRKTCSVLVDELTNNRFKVSDTAQMLVWTADAQEYKAEKLILKNLQNGRMDTIEAGKGEYLLPLGFMGDDLIYGVADQKDVVREVSSKVFFPMHTIRIQDGNQNVLKEYTVPQVYTTECEVKENQITLHRIRKDLESEHYEVIEDDQIMNSKEEIRGKNSIEEVVTEPFETVVQLRIKEYIDYEKLKVLTPKEVLFEGENEVDLPEEPMGMGRYYVYTSRGLGGVYEEEAEAITQAYELAGVVMNESGGCVWYKGNRVARNQIMKITGEKESETVGQLAVCLNTILQFEGINRNTQYMLDSGKAITEILQENIRDVQVLNLAGCSLDAILYYVNQDIPVLITLQENRAMLVIGFNELNIVVMNPENGEVYKIGMHDATELFEENGNQFITYMRINH